MEEGAIVTTLTLTGGYRFLVQFDQEGVPPLLMDEPAPLGEGSGPSASRVLSAAIGNCLTASALYCLQKARVPVHGMRTSVETHVGRNPQGRLRIHRIAVRIEPEFGPEAGARAGRCLGLFEEFCVVTQSVRQGIPVEVSLEIPEGR